MIKVIQNQLELLEEFRAVVAMLHDKNPHEFTNSFNKNDHIINNSSNSPPENQAYGLDRVNCDYKFCTKLL